MRYDEHQSNVVVGVALFLCCRLTLALTHTSYLSNFPKVVALCGFVTTISTLVLPSTVVRSKVAVASCAVMYEQTLLQTANLWRSCL